MIARDAWLLVLVGAPTLVWYGFWRFAGLSLTVAAGRKLLIALGLLAASVLAAALTGRAQDYFLPGIVVDAVYAVVLLGSILMRRPLIGVVLRVFAGRWRFEVPGSARVHSLLTFVWAVRFAAEAAVMTVLGPSPLILDTRDSGS